MVAEILVPDSFGMFKEEEEHGFGERVHLHLLTVEVVQDDSLVMRDTQVAEFDVVGENSLKLFDGDSIFNLKGLDLIDNRLCLRIHFRLDCTIFRDCL